MKTSICGKQNRKMLVSGPLIQCYKHSDIDNCGICSSRQLEFIIDPVQDSTYWRFIIPQKILLQMQILSENSMPYDVIKYIMKFNIKIMDRSDFIVDYAWKEERFNVLEGSIGGILIIEDAHSFLKYGLYSKAAVTKIKSYSPKIMIIFRL